jgi:NAD(P)-dependent dehydrogenase (short-subunit alcohol dehydrogenase family)
VLVVGAGTMPSNAGDAPVGNGRAISVLAAREGATLICADRDRAAAAETVSWIEREGGNATAAANLPATSSVPGRRFRT